VKVHHKKLKKVLDHLYIFFQLICSFFVFSDGTDNEDELRITESRYDQGDSYKLTPHIGRAPIFLQSLLPIISKAGDIVTLTCTVTATPMPSAIW